MKTALVSVSALVDSGSTVNVLLCDIGIRLGLIWENQTFPLPEMVDKTLILRKIADLEEYLGQMKDYSEITVSDYSDDWKTQRIVERT